jgi:hypothetical protein
MPKLFSLQRVPLFSGIRTYLVQTVSNEPAQTLGIPGLG